MKKLAKRLSLDTHTLRPLQATDLSQVQGGSYGSSGTSVIAPVSRQSGPSGINPGAPVQTIGTSGTSVISAGGGH